MMMSEFIERTGITPSLKEYRVIEESYYEFEGDKDEFCKAWLRDKRSGKWALEYRLRTALIDQKAEIEKLRKALADQKAESEKLLAEKEKKIDFYRPYYDRAHKAEQRLESMASNLEVWAGWLREQQPEGRAASKAAA